MTTRKNQSPKIRIHGGIAGRPGLMQFAEYPCMLTTGDSWTDPDTGIKYTLRVYRIITHKPDSDGCTATIHVALERKDPQQ